MAKFILNKLVRDKLVAEYEQLGQKAKYRKLTKDEHLAELKRKIIEEAREIPTEAEKDKIAGEIADVQQALDDLKALADITDTQVADLQRAKLAKRGGFLTGSFVESLTLKEGDEWVDYYRREPGIFIEVDEKVDHITAVPSIEPGEYEHYKGKRYEVLGVGRHSESEEYFVVYTPLYEHDGQPDLWLRPYEMFVGSVTMNGESTPRFKRISK